MEEAKHIFTLGLEFSTQSAKAVVLNTDSGNVVASQRLEYDQQYPEYRTEGGVLPSDDPRVRHTSPLMIVQALEGLIQQLKDDGAPLEQVGALKLDAQQHCTVYSDERLEGHLQSLKSGRSLAEQIQATFSRASSPIWEDRSTEQEARELSVRVDRTGTGLGRRTGNRAELRFPASQIIRWAQNAPKEYERTAHIQLLSAFLTSLLVGKLAPVDTGDGWGTNLNSLSSSSPGWDSGVLQIVAELAGLPGGAAGLEQRLGSMVAYGSPLGPVAPYWRECFGIPEDAIVLAGTGDNPATLLGTGGQAVLSLGSSYTINGRVEAPEPKEHAEYNTFGFLPPGAMTLAVITNGAKLHDTFRQRYLGEHASWSDYTRAAGNLQVSEEEPLMLPYLLEESVPTRPAGIIRSGLDEDDPKANIRALHLSQALSLANHASHLAHLDRLCVVGGGAANPTLMQMVTDAFGVPGYRIRNADSAAPLGCAIDAARVMLGISADEAANRFVQVEPGSELEPQVGQGDIYTELRARYADLEKQSES